MVSQKVCFPLHYHRSGNFDKESKFFDSLRLLGIDEFVKSL